MIKLRPYQADTISEIYDAWSRHRSVLAVLPTGGGKTVIFAEIIRRHIGAAAAVAHRKEIIAQIAMSLAQLGIRHRIIAPPAVVRYARRDQLEQLGKSFVDPNSPIGVISVQTLTSKRRGELPWLRQVRLCVYDEGHHYVKTGIWARAVDMMHDDAKLLLTTATPERADGKGLGAHSDGFADVMVEGPTTKRLINQCYLSPYRYYAPSTDLDVSDVALTASGDFNATALRNRVIESHLVGDTVNHYHTIAPGRRAIVFAVDVVTSEELAEAFRGRGYTAEALSGKTEQGRRGKVLAAFKRGEVQVLVNVNLFDEGFDVPAVEVVVMARPTQSLAKFLQMIGRGLRIMEGKAEAVIIDPVRNWERHGMPDWPRQWTLDGSGEGGGGPSDMIPQRVCAACTQPYEAYHKVCPYCGAVIKPAGRSLPEQVDGDLAELDVEAMAQLFEKMRIADCSDDDYQRSPEYQRLHPLGKPRALKRHRDAKYRRQVLRELVGWWVGSQPGRDLAEVHRRFYYRFGRDIGSAFTLDAKETDKLIASISSGFSLDMEHCGGVGCMASGSW